MVRVAFKENRNKKLEKKKVKKRVKEVKERKLLKINQRKTDLESQQEKEVMYMSAYNFHVPH